MPRFIKDRKAAKGQVPGSPVFIGNKKVEAPHITLFDYAKEIYTEKEKVNLDDLKKLKSSPTVSWINIYGIHDTKIIQSLGEIFDIQPLFVANILNTDQRPLFIEDMQTQGFILKIIHLDSPSSSLETDQISIFYGKHFVITFQEQKTHLLEVIRERIRKGTGRVRTSGSDYLVYVILDTIIDDYLDTIGFIGEKVEDLGRMVINNSPKKISSEFYRYKIEINYLRKNIRPVKEMILTWMKSDNELINKNTRAYLHDLSELVTQAEESIEIYSNLLNDGLYIYNTNISNKANEIMKVLTLFTAIFIPLTFLAGIYGMNFKYFPELSFRYGYPLFWFLVMCTGGGLFLFFKKRKWF
jgi:magnesium transporter